MIKDKVKEYDVLRVVAILLVVIGHSDFLYSHDFDISNKISTNLVAFQIDYLTVRPWIYSFHMPLFMMLSGALFAFTGTKKYNLTSYFKNRLNRLLIPFVLCGVFFSIPLKFISGYFGSHTLLYAYARSLIALLTPGHLWFLWVLFVISILFSVLILSKFSTNRSEQGLLLAFLLILNLLSYTATEWFQINRLMEYAFYYYLGYLFEHKEIRKKLSDRIKLTTVTSNYTELIILLLISFIGVFLSKFQTIFLVGGILKIAKALIGSMFMYLLCTLITYKTNCSTDRCFILLLKNNFAIYLYHEPLQFFLLYLLDKFNTLTIFNDNMPYIILCILRFIITVMVSIGIGCIVQEGKKRCINAIEMRK